MNQTSVDSKKEDIEMHFVTMEQRDHERGHLKIETGYKKNPVNDLEFCKAQEGILFENDMYKSKNGEIKQFAKGSYQQLEEREANKTQNEKDRE